MDADLYNRITPEQFEEKRDAILRSYAVKNLTGRLSYEELGDYKTDFQIDRDRIIHSKAFRRLLGKTQVFLAFEADHYRTRLTHTLEVYRLATSIARYLGLNEDLAGAIALGHDLGHTPFGHAVENAMNEEMREEGGFQHGIQGIRAVCLLEERPGAERKCLNLTVETLEGILKHSMKTIGKVDLFWLEYPNHPGSLEAQVVAICDDIAHVIHDFEDGIRSGLIDEAIKEGIIHEERKSHIWQLFEISRDEEKHCRYIRHRLEEEVTETTLKNLEDNNIRDYEGVRRYKDRLVKLGKLKMAFEQLDDFVDVTVRNSPTVAVLDNKARKFVEELWQSFTEGDGIKRLPWKVQNRILNVTEEQQRLYEKFGWYKYTEKRIICDYIAGMTDARAIKEYGYLFGYPSASY